MTDLITESGPLHAVSADPGTVHSGPGRGNVLSWPDLHIPKVLLGGTSCSQNVADSSKLWTG